MAGAAFLLACLRDDAPSDQSAAERACAPKNIQPTATVIPAQPALALFAGGDPSVLLA
jgi:hypothetical protein